MSNEEISAQLGEVVAELHQHPKCLSVMEGFFLEDEGNPDLITGWFIQATYSGMVSHQPLLLDRISAATGLMSCQHYRRANEVTGQVLVLWKWHSPDRCYLGEASLCHVKIDQRIAEEERAHASQSA